MSRYIDADAFLKEYCEPYPYVYKAMSKAMADAPSIDLVRCKECRYWNTKGCRDGVGECEWAYYMTKPNDFCSYGEREGE